MRLYLELQAGNFILWRNSLSVQSCISFAPAIFSVKHADTAGSASAGWKGPPLTCTALAQCSDRCGTSLSRTNDIPPNTYFAEMYFEMPWGRASTLYVRRQLQSSSIGSVNGLAPTRRQAIIWEMVVSLLMHTCVTWPQRVNVQNVPIQSTVVK